MAANRGPADTEATMPATTPPIIVAPSEDHLTKGDLHARISGNTIYIPRSAAQAFSQQGVRTAVDLLSYMQTYPSAVGNALNWSSEDVATATQRLRNELKGKVSEDVLNPRSTDVTPPLGARNPNEK